MKSDEGRIRYERAKQRMSTIKQMAEDPKEGPCLFRREEDEKAATTKDAELVVL